MFPAFSKYNLCQTQLKLGIEDSFPHSRTNTFSNLDKYILQLRQKQQALEAQRLISYQRSSQYNRCQTRLSIKAYFPHSDVLQCQGHLQGSYCQTL